MLTIKLYYDALQERNVWGNDLGQTSLKLLLLFLLLFFLTIELSSGDLIVKYVCVYFLWMGKALFNIFMVSLFIAVLKHLNGDVKHGCFFFCCNKICGNKILSDVLLVKGYFVCFFFN